jgi:hypothetical protein
MVQWPGRVLARGGPHLARSPLPLIAAVLGLSIGITACGSSQPSAAELEHNAQAAVPGSSSAAVPFIVSGSTLRAYLPRQFAHLVKGDRAFIELVKAKRKHTYVFLENKDGRLIVQLPMATDLASLPSSYLTTWPSGERRLLQALQGKPPFSTFITNIVGVRMLHVPGNTLRRYFRKALTLSPRRRYPVASFLVLPALPTGNGQFAYLVLVNVVMNPTNGNPLGTYTSSVPLSARGSHHTRA